MYTYIHSISGISACVEYNIHIITKENRLKYIFYVSFMGSTDL